MRSCLTITLVFLVCFSGFSQQSDDWYQGKPIRRIEFSGLHNVKPTELEGITEPFVNKPFTDDIYWDILGRLYALEYFENISPSAFRADTAGNEVILRFAVVERPTVSRININGNSGVRRNELLDTITTKVNDVATHLKLRMDEQAIINKYLEKGYPDIKVSSEMQNT
ncbi:MAG: outer membrane protein assembly factor BamA, partial [Treponema sp.]|nr:outer membrane protein assembly factor BamA [Treponema sp.]